MYPMVGAFSLVGLMICLGMIVRTKVKFLRNMLVPVNVIAGILGLLYVNTINDFILPDVTSTEFNTIVDVFFTFSFISIGLASVSNKKKKKEKTEKVKGTGGESIAKGAFGMGMIWCTLFGITAVIGMGIIGAVGSLFGMDPIYGVLIPYAFCQGPGQAANMGYIFETEYGIANAQMVGVTFAVVGFIAAFVIGIPLARYGLRKKLAKNTDEISETIVRGYYTPEEQRESVGKVTTYSGTLETLALHIAFMGVSYLLAVLVSEIILQIPILGAMFGNMLFIWGMVTAYFVKWVLRKMNVEYLLNISLQNKITGFTSDFLVVAAFMAIRVSVIGQWIIPIVIECIIISLLTFLICTYFMSRLGSSHDFERVLGMYGMCTGTTPSGIALVRIVDPKLKTPVATELGMTNIFMLLVMPVSFALTFYFSEMLSLPMMVLIILAFSAVYIVAMKIFGVWNKPSFSLLKGTKNEINEEEAGKADKFVQGVLRYTLDDGNSGVIN